MGRLGGDIPLRTSVRAARSFSWSSFGRPGCRPSARAAATPSRVRSAIRRRSNFAMAPSHGAISASPETISGTRLTTPSNASVLLRANHFNPKGLAFLAGIMGQRTSEPRDVAAWCRASQRDTRPGPRELQPLAVHQQVHRCTPRLWSRHLQHLGPAAESAVVRYREIEAKVSVPFFLPRR